MQNPFLFTSPAHPFSFTQAAQKTFPAAHFPCTGPFPRPWPNPAQRHTLPPCLTARRAPPVGSVSLPRPSRTQAQSPTRSRTRRCAPLLGPHAKDPRPYLSARKTPLDPLEAAAATSHPNPSRGHHWSSARARCQSRRSVAPIASTRRLRSIKPW